jgi:hypothetical protein
VDRREEIRTKIRKRLQLSPRDRASYLAQYLLGKAQPPCLVMRGSAGFVDQAARESLSATLTPSTAAGGADGERWTG